MNTLVLSNDTKPGLSCRDPQCDPQSHLCDCQWWQWLESTQRGWQSCGFGLNSAKNQQHKLWGWGLVSKQLQPRVTFFYCSGWCEPSQMSGFQSLPSLAQYWLMTGCLHAVWAVHTLYQPVRKGGKVKQDVSEKIGFTSSEKSACSLLSVFTAQDTVKGFFLQAAGNKCPAKEGANSKAGQKTPESHQSWISQWLPGLQHTWRGWSSAWCSIGKLSFDLETHLEPTGTWILVEHLPHV